MKKIVSIVMAVLLLFSLSACGSSEEQQSSQEENIEISESVPSTETEQTANNSTGSRILIAYFSMPEDVDTSDVDAVSSASVVVKDGEVQGNTEYVAKIIQETVGGELFRIETVQDYPLDHDTLIDQAAEEQEENLRPELKNHIENLERYDTIILGFPNWLAYHKLIQCTQLA